MVRWVLFVLLFLLGSLPAAACSGNMGCRSNLRVLEGVLELMMMERYTPPGVPDGIPEGIPVQNGLGVIVDAGGGDDGCSMLIREGYLKTRPVCCYLGSVYLVPWGGTRGSSYRLLCDHMLPHDTDWARNALERRLDPESDPGNRMFTTRGFTRLNTDTGCRPPHWYQYRAIRAHALFGEFNGLWQTHSETITDLENALRREYHPPLQMMLQRRLDNVRTQRLQLLGWILAKYPLLLLLLWPIGRSLRRRLRPLCKRMEGMLAPVNGWQ